MNAFFLIKASDPATFAWLASLMEFIYKRPYVHDQLAYSLFLGVTPLVDEEPLPTPPTWAPLDPNVFGNAARFDGLGFSSEVKDLVFFHFFDGWNSNSPDSVDYWATPTYKGINIFDVLYSRDEDAAAATIARSRLPPPKELKDCSYMAGMGLGVQTNSVLVSVDSEGNLS